LYDASKNDQLYEDIKDVLESNIPIKSSLADMAEEYFKEAAKKGYVYAANNLAAREADRISEMDDDTDPAELGAAVDRYVEYLKMSADRYEPYAANRLGLFYMTGEITGKGGSSRHKSYVDSALAKEYFIKATICPDANSAWAFFNLIKYFHKDYDNDIEHMNEHMDYIKELNPHVYGLAMEL
jgi:TPR repeat protein